MSNLISVEAGKFKCDIGKKSEGGFVNIICYFNPIRHPDLIEMLDAHTDSVDYVSNAQRYDDDFGGLCVKMNKEFSVMDLLDPLTRILSRMET